MPLNGCKCRICRMVSDGSQIREALEDAARPLSVEQTQALEKIVKEAWAKVQAATHPQHCDGQPK